MKRVKARFTEITGQGDSPANNGLFENIEALFTTFAVVAALVSTLALADRWSVTGDQHEHMAFRLSMCRLQSFREFAVHTMKTYDIGKYEHETLNFTVDLGFRTFNAADVVLKESWSDLSNYDVNAFDKCLGDALFVSATEHILKEFPLERMKMWILLHEDRDQVMSVIRNPERWMLYASALLASSMFTSVIGLFSLYASPVKWDKKGFIWELMYWIPLVVVCAASLIVGSIFFFIGQNQALNFASVSYHESKYITDWTFFALLVPILTISAAGLLFTILWGWCRNPASTAQAGASPGRPEKGMEPAKAEVKKMINDLLVRLMEEVSGEHPEGGERQPTQI